MDSNGVDQNQINTLQDSLARTLIMAYENKEIGYKDMKEAARYISDSVPNLKTDENIAGFMSELTDLWPIFGSVQRTEQKRGEQESEQAVIDRLSQYIKNLQPN